MLGDILRGEDPQVIAAQDALIATNPDIIVLQSIDFDLQNAALNAFADALEQRGSSYPYRFALRPNTGMPTGVDLNGDGKLGGGDDAQGFGRFSGQGGMAILSRFPVLQDKVTDHSGLLWRDMPGNLFPMTDTGPFGGDAAYEIQRLSSKGHWVVPISTPNFGPINVMTFHATPPVFDGAEDRNGRRNHDEVALWSQLLKDHSDFVLLGDANIDPERGEGRKAAINALITDPRLQNPFPNAPTANWPDPGPGELRVDYLLPSIDWKVVDFGLFAAPNASRHLLLWADLEPTDP
ncbi:endonuclease/exonuclease/phosphatase family protein [Sulfitobacter sp. SK012]|uniref:endonuclease/exonuclease/phosphatase family protein n=1 Tax=Sulfitobacter sp. SK012 TaxID=1389005 RepID=UPI0020C77670|nr:endonuclease/exonuclease/phosphatase family protein [Sulfitobacter sp. SK012]